MADSAKSKNRAYIVLEVPACGGFRKVIPATNGLRLEQLPSQQSLTSG